MLGGSWMGVFEIIVLPFATGYPSEMDDKLLAKL
jgi:hypothetical protein